MVFEAFGCWTLVQVGPEYGCLPIRSSSLLREERSQRQFHFCCWKSWFIWRIWENIQKKLSAISISLSNSDFWILYTPKAERIDWIGRRTFIAIATLENQQITITFDVPTYRCIHSKSGFPGCLESAENSNFPQKDCLRTRKLPNLQCVRKNSTHRHTQPLFYRVK